MIHVKQLSKIQQKIIFRYTVNGNEGNRNRILLKCYHILLKTKIKLSYKYLFSIPYSLLCDLSFLLLCCFFAGSKLPFWATICQSLYCFSTSLDLSQKDNNTSLESSFVIDRL